MIPELPLVHLETYLAYHKAPTPRPTNVMEITIDSMGSSCVKPLTGTEVRLREQVRAARIEAEQKAAEAKHIAEQKRIAAEKSCMGCDDPKAT